MVLHVQINEERLVSLHGDVQSLRVHSSAIEELLTTLTIRVEGMFVVAALPNVGSLLRRVEFIAALEAGSSGAQSTTSVSALASKMDSHGNLNDDMSRCLHGRHDVID